MHRVAHAYQRHVSAIISKSIYLFGLDNLLHIQCLQVMPFLLRIAKVYIFVPACKF